MTLTDYIQEYYGGSKEDIAAAWGVNNVTKIDTWIRTGYIMVDHRMYSPRRDGVQIFPPNMR